MKRIQIILSSLYIIALSTQSYASTDINKFCFKNNKVEGQEMVESNLVTLQGLKQEETVKLKGTGGYILNGVYMGRDESTVKNGDKIRLVHESSDEDGAKVSTMLIIGDSYGTFTTVTDHGGLSSDHYKIEGLSCDR
jgi:hypothetical protein